KMASSIRSVSPGSVSGKSSMDHLWGIAQFFVTRSCRTDRMQARRPLCDQAGDWLSWHEAMALPLLIAMTSSQFPHHAACALSPGLAECTVGSFDKEAVPPSR